MDWRWWRSITTCSIQSQRSSFFITGGGDRLTSWQPGSRPQWMSWAKEASRQKSSDEQAGEATTTNCGSCGNGLVYLARAAALFSATRHVRFWWTDSPRGLHAERPCGATPLGFEVGLP